VPCTSHCVARCAWLLALETTDMGVSGANDCKTDLGRREGRAVSQARLAAASGLVAPPAVLEGTRWNETSWVRDPPAVSAPLAASIRRIHPGLPQSGKLERARQLFVVESPHWTLRRANLTLKGGLLGSPGAKAQSKTATVSGRRKRRAEGRKTIDGVELHITDGLASMLAEGRLCVWSPRQAPVL
jgi:hypothetical protein